MAVVKSETRNDVTFLHKILHLRSSEGMLGAENVIIEIAKNSQKFGYISIIGVLKDMNDPQPELISLARESGLQTVIFTCDKRFDMKCAKLISQYVITNNIKIIHCHGYKEDFYAVMSRSAVPKLATNHLWKTNTLMLRLYRILDILLLRCFDKVVGVSDEIVSEMKKLGINKSIKVQNGVDVAKFNIDHKAEHIISEFKLGKGIVFGMISSLTKEKNHVIAIESLAKVQTSDVQLLIVGDGPMRKELQAQVIRHGLDKKVIFTGCRDNIKEILSIVDVFLLPSLKEGLPMAMLEAMACGKAVIASRVGENNNVINDRVNGIIVEPGDVDSLIKAMRLMIEDSNLIKQYGQQARYTVEKQFSSQLMTKKYCSLYNQLLTDVTV